MLHSFCQRKKKEKTSFEGIIMTEQMSLILRRQKFFRRRQGKKKVYFTACTGILMVDSCFPFYTHISCLTSSLLQEKKKCVHSLSRKAMMMMMFFMDNLKINTVQTKSNIVVDQQPCLKLGDSLRKTSNLREYPHQVLQSCRSILLR